MSHSDLPLFAWKPPVQFIPFPLDRQIGRVRDVACKLSTKTTDRHAERYAAQVTDGLVARLQRIGLPETEIDDQVERFWTRVEQEAVRMSYCGRTGGDAA